MTTGIKAIFNIVILAITLAANTLGALGIIGGLSQKDISDMYHTLITPVSATFSIWSIIYTLIIVSFVTLALKYKDTYYKKIIEAISPLFWFSSLINILWIISFSFLLIELSTLLIFILLITLIVIDKKLKTMEGEKRWLVPATFGMYSGWLLIATVVNIAAMLVKLRWTGFGISYETWAAFVLIVAIFLVIIVMTDIKNAIFPIPIAWAYWGINKNLQTLSQDYNFLRITVLIAMILLLSVALIQFLKNRFRILPE